jgi:predicted MFS family arabinose efflux permease
VKLAKPLTFPRHSKDDGWLLTGLVAATFLSLVHYLSYSPLLPEIAQDLQLDIGQLGQMPAAIGIGAAVVGLLAGPLADRYGKQRTLLFGVLALILSAIGLAVAPGAAALPVIAVLAGIGRATVSPLALAIASAEYAGDRQRRAVSRIMSSLGVAPLIGVPLVTCVAAALDWRTAWLALAVVTGLACVSLWGLFRTTATHAQQQATESVSARQALSAYRLLLRHRPSLGLLGGTFMMNVGGWPIWTYLGAFLVRQHGFDTQAAGWAWMVVGLGLFAGPALAGGRLAKVPLERLFGLSALAASLAFSSAFMLPVSGWLAVGLVGVATLLHGMTQVVTAMLLPADAPTGRAATMTLRGAAASLGAGAGACIGGLVLEQFGFAAVGFVALAGCLSAAALVWWGRGQAASRKTGKSSRPWSAAHAATWARLETPSLSKICWTWLSAVRGAITSRSAICRLVKPWAIRTATSCSRSVNGRVCMCGSDA